MTARTTTRKRTPKPPGRLRRGLRRCVASPWALSLEGVAVLVLALLAAAPRLLPLALLPLGAVLGIAADRLREHWGWHRKGGRAAMRQRRRYQGRATIGELARNLPDRDGVLIGTVRRGSSW